MDDVLRDLHDDRDVVTEDQLTLVEREINRRRLLSAERVVMLFGQIGTLQEEILRLVPEHEFGPDPHRSLREPKERERRELERELQDEVRNRWKDVQELRREQRQLLRERTEERQRYERHTGNYDG